MLVSRIRTRLFATVETNTSLHRDDESLSWDLNVASDSLGSMLLRLQKQEAIEMQKAMMDSDTPSLQQVGNEPRKQQKSTSVSQQSELASMDKETARELDAAVTYITGIPDQLRAGIQVLPVPSLYTSPNAPLSGELVLPRLSQPEHYKDRIGRDIRHLAVSIANNVAEIREWRLFCQEQGGLRPLFECIGEPDHSFSSAACRAIRDLCALSPEIVAIITDEILRANAEWDGRLMRDFVAILKCADEAEQDKAAPLSRKQRTEARQRCKLYVLQLLLAMAMASDVAVDVLRETEGLKDAVVQQSSFALPQRTKRWIRYPVELWKSRMRGKKQEHRSRPFIEAASVTDDLKGTVQGTANQVLAVMGVNKWVPKIPGQKGLRILCLDGGGTRGMAAVTSLRGLVKAMGGLEASETFDIICGTSTGAIIAFLIGLRKETSRKAKERYNALIKRIFVKSAVASMMYFFTTASYDEAPFMEIMSEILGDHSMLDSRADPTVPLVFAVSSKMSSTPTHVALFRNYNYASDEIPDSFVVDAKQARIELGFPVEFTKQLPKSAKHQIFEENRFIQGSRLTDKGSRHPGSFRVLQRYALRASTAAPTVFKPVFMSGEMYCDGGIVASNPTAIAIHEARTVYPDIPIELVVSIGTGGFQEERKAPKLGWEGIVSQIVNSATDAERVHHLLEDILGSDRTFRGHNSFSSTRYYRLNPNIGSPNSNNFPIDGTDPEKLAKLAQITEDYLLEPESQESLKEIRNILDGKRGWRKFLPW